MRDGLSHIPAMGFSSRMAPSSAWVSTVTREETPRRSRTACWMRAEAPRTALARAVKTTLPLLSRVRTSMKPRSSTRRRSSAIGTFLLPPRLTPRRRAMQRMGGIYNAGAGIPAVSAVAASLLLLGCAGAPASGAAPDPSPRLMTPSDLQALPSRPPTLRAPYGPESSQYGELRVPRGAGPHPVAV